MKFKMSKVTINVQVIFSDQERRLSATEEALKKLNLPKFLPSVPLSQYYVRPEFDVSGLQIQFDEKNFPESDRAKTPFPGTEPDQILKETENLRKKDVDQQSFVLPGLVNAGL
jgi:hypothetical protein